MEAALRDVKGEFGRQWPLVIGGKHVATDLWIDSLNPCQKSQVVGRAARAGPGEAQQALDAAWAAFGDWSRWQPAERARLIFKAAALLRRRKHLFSATMVYEAGKTWPEADGDTAEAIDFLEYYGREALRLTAPRQLPRLAGEDNGSPCTPIGAGVAIPPWNFPLAITTNLVVAPLVTGNTVLPPSPRSPVIAAKLMEMLEAIGLPAGVVNFVTGADAVIGDVLVDHPQTRFVGFTGSKEIGLRVNERAAKIQPGQKWIKRVMLEMGGKDTMIVDETADLEAAAQGIAAAAFGFQGQKCSACSRVVAVASVYQDLLAKVIERASKLTSVGDPSKADTSLGAVIDDRSIDKIRHYLTLGQQEGRLVLGGEAQTEGGYFVQPTIFADVAPDAHLSQEEVFGPVLTFVKADDFEQAIAIANNTEYGLTGGLFSQDEERLARAGEDFHVGNLYLNRKITGAMVGVHPFGGFNMSGHGFGGLNWKEVGEGRTCFPPDLGGEAPSAA